MSRIALIGSAFPMRVSEALLAATRDDEPLAQDMVNIWSHSAYAHYPSNPGPGFWVLGENLRLMQRQQPGVMHVDFKACNDYAAGAERAAKVACPALFVLGRRDVMTPVGHAKDSLWSVDLFRCESIVLKSHWVMVVMDQYTQRISGFGTHAGAVDGPNLCWMFNSAIARMGTPTYLSTDHDPLFTFHRWHANLRILEIDEIKTVPPVPVSHPFVERPIDTLRREYLDQVLFWNGTRLKKKLDAFKDYYNGYRVHAALDGKPPLSLSGNDVLGKANINEYRWKSHCRDLFHTPMAV